LLFLYCCFKLLFFLDIDIAVGVPLSGTIIGHGVLKLTDACVGVCVPHWMNEVEQWHFGDTIEVIVVHTRTHTRTKDVGVDVIPVSAWQKATVGCVMW
jgi:hypothetical protein